MSEVSLLILERNGRLGVVITTFSWRQISVGWSWSWSGGGWSTVGVVLTICAAVLPC